MRKKTVFIFICLFLFFGSCNLQVPEKVILKTNPTYNFNVGSFSKSFSEELSLKPLFESLEEKDSRIKVYDYNPNMQSEYQQFLVKMPIQEIPLNFGDLVESIGLSSSVGDMSFSRVIEIPKIEMQQTSEFDTTDLKDTIDKFVYGNGEAPEEEFVPFVGKDFFNSISYTSGFLVVKGEFTGNAQFTRGNEVVLESTFDDGEASFDLSGKTLYSDMKLKLPSSGNYTMETKETSINSVTGLVCFVELSSDCSVDLGFESLGIKKCIISEGVVKNTVSIPSTWSGVKVEKSVELEGAIQGSFSEDDIKLENIELEEDCIEATTIAKMTLENATINFNDKVKFDISFEVNSFSEIKMELSQENLSFNKQFDFPQEVIDFINKIYIKESGIEGNYKNTLPEGNDIKIKAKSDFINLNNTETLFSNTNGKEFSILSSSEEIEKNVDNSTKLDFEVDVILPGATESEPNILSIKNVEAGKEYEIEIDLGFELNWTKVELNSIDVEEAKGAIATDFSLTSIFSEIDNFLGTDFASKMKIDSLPLYLYVEKPSISAFDSFSFSDASSIKIGNGTVNGDTVNFVSSPKEMTCTKMASFPKLEFTANSDTVITNISKEQYTSFVDLKEIINDQSGAGSKLCIQYDIGFGMSNDDSPNEITKEDLEKAKGGTSIAINFAIIVPLRFFVSEEIEVDLLKVADFTFEGDKDLFNRTQPTESEELNTVLENIKKTTLKYAIKKSPFNANGIKLKVMLTPDNEEILGFDKGEISINPEELLNTWPLQPKTFLVLKKDSFFYFSHSKDFEVDTSIQIDTDVEVELFGGQE